MPVPLLQANGDYYQWPKSWTYESDKDSNGWPSSTTKPVSPTTSCCEQGLRGVNDYKRTSYSTRTISRGATQIYNLENNPGGFPFWLSYPTDPL